MKELSNYISEAKPFKWGENDCMLFAAKYVKKVTGNDFYSAYGSYSTEEEAAAILEKNGGILAMVNKALGQSYENYRKAKRGDIVLVRVPNDTIGIVDDTGERIACLSHSGVVRIPLRKMIYGWGVKCQQ